MRWLALVLATGCSSILGLPEANVVGGGPDASPKADAPPAVPDAAPDAAVLVRLTLAKDGGGKGTLKIVDGAECGPDCGGDNVDVVMGQTVTIEAKPAAGSHFRGFAGACGGSHRFCTVNLTGAKSVTATFAVTDHNIVFQSSKLMKGDFGGLDAADLVCKEAAMGAGLSGNFVAWLSTATTNAKDRLVVPGTQNTPRGFMRPDGKPISDTLADLTYNQVIYWSAKLDENGKDPLTRQSCCNNTWSGTDAFGNFSGKDCNNWMSSDTSVEATWGCPDSHLLLSCFAYNCNAMNAISCVQVDFTAPLAPPPAQQGKVMFITRGYFVPGGGLTAADALCNEEKPAGTGTFKALLATTTIKASTVLTPTQLYVRPDGVPVGLGSDVVNRTMMTAPWIHGDGTYGQFTGVVWSGSRDIGIPGASNENCVDWTSTTPKKAQTGGPTMQALFGGQEFYDCNNVGSQLVCVEQQ